MIHKRNLTITAFVWAGIIAAAFLLFPKIYHGSLVGWYYLPTVVLAVIISHLSGGNPQSPSNPVGWSAFGVYTIFYWAVFLVVYVILLEFYLLRRVMHQLDDVKQNLASDRPDSRLAFDKIGQAITELEARRRRHFLLKPLDLPDFPSDQRHVLAAHAISRSANAGPVKAILKKLRKKLAAQTNPETAAALLGKLKGDATRLASQYDASKTRTDSGSSSQSPTGK